MEKLTIQSLHILEEYNNLNNVVMEVVWQLSKKLPYQGPNSEDMFVFAGSTTILDDPDPSKFISFNELQSENIESWIRSSQEFKDKQIQLEKEYRSRTIFNMIVKDPPWTIQ